MPADEQRILKLERALVRTQSLLVLVTAAGSIAIWWLHSLAGHEPRTGEVVIAEDRITIGDRVRLDANGLAVADGAGKVELDSAGIRLTSSPAAKAEMLIVPDRVTMDSPRGSVAIAGDAFRLGTVTESFDVTLLPEPNRAAVLKLKSGAGAQSGSGIELDAGVHPIASGSCFTKSCDYVWSLGAPGGDHINPAHAAR